MPRKDSPPRNRQILIRLSGDELDVLESVAHLEDSTANGYVRRIVLAELARRLSDPHVKIDIENRRSYRAARDSSVTSITAARKGRGPIT